MNAKKALLSPLTILSEAGNPAEIHALEHALDLGIQINIAATQNTIKNLPRRLRAHAMATDVIGMGGFHPSHYLTPNADVILNFSDQDRSLGGLYNRPDTLLDIRKASDRNGFFEKFKPRAQKGILLFLRNPSHESEYAKAVAYHDPKRAAELTIKRADEEALAIELFLNELRRRVQDAPKQKFTVTERKKIARTTEIPGDGHVLYFSGFTPVSECSLHNVFQFRKGVFKNWLLAIEVASELRKVKDIDHEFWQKRADFIGDCLMYPTPHILKVSHARRQKP